MLSHPTLRIGDHHWLLPLQRAPGRLHRQWCLRHKDCPARDRCRERCQCAYGQRLAGRSKWRPGLMASSHPGSRLADGVAGGASGWALDRLSLMLILSVVPFSTRGGPTPAMRISRGRSGSKVVLTSSSVISAITSPDAVRRTRPRNGQRARGAMVALPRRQRQADLAARSCSSLLHLGLSRRQDEIASVNVTCRRLHGCRMRGKRAVWCTILIGR